MSRNKKPFGKKTGPFGKKTEPFGKKTEPFSGYIPGHEFSEPGSIVIVPKIEDFNIQVVKSGPDMVYIVDTEQQKEILINRIRSIGIVGVVVKTKDKEDYLGSL